MRPKAYIGITGFMSRAEVAATLSVLPTDTKQLVMIGVLASSKSLYCAPSNPKRYPMPNELGKIFTPRTGRLNLLHFNTNERERLFDDLCEARDLGEPNCHGFQLNIAWPSVDVVQQYKSRYPKDTIVLQCGMRALQAADNEPEKVAYMVAGYSGLIDYVLVDPSGGQGRPFKHEMAERYLDAMGHILPDVGLGIAGGLHAANVYATMYPLLKRFGAISIDAEGQLRDKEDTLLVPQAQAYLQQSIALYSKMFDNQPKVSAE